ncbi:MAG: hypothetical protein ACRDPY_36585 [Streptosporangiaceae bacterium]
MRSRAACPAGPDYGHEDAPMNVLDPTLVPWARDSATRQTEDIKSRLQAI